MAYQQIIDDPGLADPSLVLDWAHKSGRLARGSDHIAKLSRGVLGEFARSHGLPAGYFTLESDGATYFLGKHPDLAPGGADPRSVAARRIDPPARWGRVFVPAAYQAVIDNPSIADPSLVLDWAHRLGRLARSSDHLGQLSRAVLGEFAESHGLPAGYYTLEWDGAKYFLGKHPDLAPGGADPRSAAAQRIDPPARWGRVFTPAAYQAVIDNPGIADPRIVVAWTHATDRMAPTATSLAVMGPGVLDDFARSHGLPAGYYTSEQLGAKYFLANHPDLAPGGADPRAAAAQRIDPPAGWPPRLFVPVAYQEVIDNPAIVDHSLIAAWAGATGRLANPNARLLSLAVVNDFTDAHGLPRRSFILNVYGNSSVLQPNPDRLPAVGDPEIAAPGRIPLPQGWRPRVPVEAHQNEQVIDPPQRLPAPGSPARSYSTPSGPYTHDAAPPYYAVAPAPGSEPMSQNTNLYSVAAQSSFTPQDPYSYPSPEVSQYPAQYDTSASYGVNQPTLYAPNYGSTYAPSYESAYAPTYAPSYESNYTQYADSAGPAFNPAGPSYAPTAATPAIQYGNSNVDQRAISYTTARMDSMSITSASWHPDAARISSSGAPTHRQADYSVTESRSPTPEQRPRKQRKRA
ncbi:hypothetical protein AB0I95_21110 [Micromonospora sp. NPDC049751]|uniref:hypothetical protein n=1 Tax=Micromonospora sp. NPDC049751 TaxID=3154837 RepID=UPI00340AAEDD